MNANELVRKLRKTGRRDGVPVTLLRASGRGSHATVVYGERRATIALHGARHELPKGTLAKILRDLGLTLDDLA